MRRRGLATAVAGLLLLAGCSSGGGAGPIAEPTTTTPSSLPSAVTGPSATAPPATQLPTDSASASDLSSLAAAAQSQATAASSVLAGEAVVGADISWPQCPPGLGIPHKESKGLPLPTADAAYVVLGLTNGPGFHANPCLADQVAWARERGLPTAAYSVISWPSAAELAQYGGPRAAGRAQAAFNLATMRAAGLTSPVVWLDVEPVPFYDWPADTAQNAEVVRGAAEGYQHAGVRIGVYSTPYLWQHVVGDLSLGVPEWRAAGETSQAEALARCGADWSIQGGEAVLGQWVEGQRDLDVTCPGVEAGRWFATPG